MFTPIHTSLLLLPSVFSSIRVFSNELALCIRWQSIGASASASILPMNIQGWFPLGLTGLVSFCPRDSQESSPRWQRSKWMWNTSTLSPWIHQEYTFRHRSACRTPAQRGQEYLTRGKEYTEPRKTQ